MRPITRRQLQVLRSIHAFQRARGMAPTLREIGAAVSIRSTNGVNDHLKALERRGLLLRGHAALARDMRVTEAGLIVLGAATPGDAQALRDEVVALARRWAHTGNGAAELREALDELDAVLEATAVPAEAAA